MKLRDYTGQYGDIVAYSGHGGIIRSYDDDFRHYLDRKVVHFWMEPVKCRAFIQIG